MLQGLSVGTQQYNPFSVFINGEYAGIRNARERKDQYYLKTSYQLPNHNVDLIKKKDAVQYGDSDKWYEFLSFVENADPTSNSYYEKLDLLTDVSSIVDYYSASVYLARNDWPGNNTAAWRYRGSEVSKESDGRWRWLIYDLDNSFSKTDQNTLEFATEQGNTKWPNPDWSTRTLRTLLKNHLFREYFITRFSDLINSYFVSERIVTIIRGSQAIIDTEMPRHIHRWGAPKNIAAWHSGIEKLEAFAQQRPEIQRIHLQEFFDLGSSYTLSVNVKDMVRKSEGQDTNERTAIVRVNTLELGVTDAELIKPVAASARAINMEKYLAIPWSGQYFQDLPLRLEALPEQGYEFSNWEIKGYDLSADEKVAPSITIYPINDVSVTAVMEKL